MKLSIIIPAYNEERQIAETVTEVQKRSFFDENEVLVIDGGSSDQTVARAEKAGARVFTSPRKGRSAQMNYGAEHARSEILYFLHADSHPPSHFDQKIHQALLEGHQAGCFQLAFDDDHWLLQSYAWFTQFDIDAFRFGDQSLYIAADAFSERGGFCEDHLLMEDNEIVRRIKKNYSFTLLEDKVETSARSYRHAGVVKLQLVFVLLYVMYFLGFEQDVLMRIRKKWIN